MMHKNVTWHSSSLTINQLKQLAICMVEASIWGMKVGLSGTLGAGKTQLVRQLMCALSSTDNISSPTYAIHHIYETPAGEVDHYDLYRLGKEEMADLELEYLLPNRTILIEWWQNYPELANVLDLCITIEHSNSDFTRKLTLEGLNARGNAWVEKLTLLWENLEV